MKQKQKHVNKSKIREKAISSKYFPEEFRNDFLALHKNNK